MSDATLAAELRAALLSLQPLDSDDFVRRQPDHDWRLCMAFGITEADLDTDNILDVALRIPPWMVGHMLLDWSFLWPELRAALKTPEYTEKAIAKYLAPGDSEHGLAPRLARLIAVLSRFNTDMGMSSVLLGPYNFLALAGYTVGAAIQESSPGPTTMDLLRTMYSMAHTYRTIDLAKKMEQVQKPAIAQMSSNPRVQNSIAAVIARIEGHSTDPSACKRLRRH